MSSRLKPNGRSFIIPEQIIEDRVTGLTLQFKATPETPDTPYRLIIIGDALPFGNREILFDCTGAVGATGTYTGPKACAANWIKEV